MSNIFNPKKENVKQAFDYLATKLGELRLSTIFSNFDAKITQYESVEVKDGETKCLLVDDKVFEYLRKNNKHISYKGYPIVKHYATKQQPIRKNANKRPL